jgi:hypothetical protein
VQPIYFSSKDVVLKGVPDGTVILSRSIPGAYAGMLVKVNKDNSTTQEETTETAQ